MTSIESIDLRFEKISKKVKNGKHLFFYCLANVDENNEISEMKYKNDIAAKRVNEHQKKLDEQIKIQEELKQHVSSKSNETVDIKAGQTIEDVYVSLRTRGKLLKGQKSKDAPILKAEQKVLLLPERSVRIIKEFLVELRDKNENTVDSLKKENDLMKETANHLFNKIKEQHERDRLQGAPEENKVKDLLKKYEALLGDKLPVYSQLDKEISETSQMHSGILDQKNMLEKENATLSKNYAEIKRMISKYNNDIDGINDMVAGQKLTEDERVRKKERVLEMQQQLLAEVNEKVHHTLKQNEVLAKELQQREETLNDMQEKCDHIGIKELDPKIEDNIHNFISVQKERRQFQDESEDMPLEWDSRFRGHVQEMSSELKKTTNEYPSNKNFPAVMDEWFDATAELNSTELNNKHLDRKINAQNIKLALMASMQNDMNDIREKLNNSSKSENLIFRNNSRGI